MNPKPKKVAIVPFNAVIGGVITLFLAGVVALAVTTNQMESHLQEIRIHKGVEELTADFMPREALEKEIKSLKEQIDRLEDIVDRFAGTN